jgi:translation initiation factor 5B
MGVKIFTADIIYHLFDQFTAYMNNIKEERKKEKAALAIWPCILKIVPGCIFNKKDPIILGVDVVEGSVKIGTPICIPSKDCLLLGKVQGIENNHKPVQIAKKGQQVAIRIEDSDGTVMAGRQFGESDELCSKISRQSIDVLKELFRADVTRDEWLLIKKLKTMLHID